MAIVYKQNKNFDPIEGGNCSTINWVFQSVDYIHLTIGFYTCSNRPFLSFDFLFGIFVWSANRPGLPDSLNCLVHYQFNVAIFLWIQFSLSFCCRVCVPHIQRASAIAFEIGKLGIKCHWRIGHFDIRTKGEGNNTIYIIIQRNCGWP